MEEEYKLAPTGCLQTTGNRDKDDRKGVGAWEQATDDTMQELKRPNIRQGLTVQKKLL